jgi:hypothetical protein
MFSSRGGQPKAINLSFGIMQEWFIPPDTTRKNGDVGGWFINVYYGLGLPHYYGNTWEYYATAPKISP